MNVYPRHRSHRLLLDATPPHVPPPSKETAKAHNNGYTETNFDTNMVIILAALLCALICALGLNSIVRCFLRCSRRFAFETPDGTAGRLVATGLKKKMLRQIPVAVYGNSGINIPATDCPICLGEFVEGEKVRVLPKCHHGFHVRCIDIWLASHSSCPTCRQSLLEQSPCPDSIANESALNLRLPSHTPPPGGGGEGHTDHPATSIEESRRTDSRETPSNETDGGTENKGYKGKNFDTNMVIILAALLCALLCALVLNLIIRCVLRCRRGIGSESVEEITGGGRLNATAGKNNCKRKLCQIPMAVYGSGIHIRATDCPICLCEFLDGEDVRILPKCHHGFHVKCIDIWLASHYSCPTCRQSLLEQSSSSLSSPSPELHGAAGEPAVSRPLG